ncbi:MAG: ATP-binding protein [Humibacillus sp.]|nr:ATP-binding protein [Humibacillus sp.]MDN5779620.1 ATP-binding protein [Humibacillus sp.]
MSQSGMVVEPHDHGVIVFQHESEWVEAVVPWLADGIRLGLRAVVVTTAERDVMLRRAMADAGVDLPATEAAGRYQCLDVQAAVSAFVGDGVLDEEAFRAVVRDILEAPTLATGGCDEGDSSGTDEAVAPTGIRMVGDAAALMVSRGGERAALDIERLCVEMTADQPVSLQCVYSADVLRGVDLALVRQVFELHTEVSVTPDGLAGEPPVVDGCFERNVDRRVEIFDGVPRSIGRVRRFIAAALDLRYHPNVVHNCALIASEMATNAYQHAGGSPFRVGVILVPGRVRITVEDTSTATPSMPHPLDRDEGGRGVVIVDALSDRWGVDSLPSGKVVWAEVVTG